MNPPRSLWSEYPLSTGIAALVCYAGVFSDVIGISEIASRLGITARSEFDTVLAELKSNGRVVLKDGFAGLPQLEEKIPVKLVKIATAAEIVNLRLEAIK